SGRKVVRVFRCLLVCGELRSGLLVDFLDDLLAGLLLGARAILSGTLAFFGFLARSGKLLRVHLLLQVLGVLPRRDVLGASFLGRVEDFAPILHLELGAAVVGNLLLGFLLLKARFQFRCGIGMSFAAVHPLLVGLDALGNAGRLLARAVRFLGDFGLERSALLQELVDLFASDADLLVVVEFLVDLFEFILLGQADADAL